MPCLAYLTCVNAEPIPITPLLEVHGTQLTYLHFTYCAEALYSDTDLPEPEDLNILSLLPRLHKLCPRISHLINPISPQLKHEHEHEEERTMTATALNIHSPTLRYHDITAPAPAPSVTVATYHTIARALAPTAHRDTPQLQKVCMVASDADDSKLLLLLPTLPSLLHPSHMPGSPDRALEDVTVSAVPGGGAYESRDERADRPEMATTGGIDSEAMFLGQWQHTWAIVRDDSELCGPGDGDAGTDTKGDSTTPWRIRIQTLFLSPMSAP